MINPFDTVEGRGTVQDDEYPEIKPEDRKLLGRCLRARYEAGASIDTLTRGVAPYRTIEALLSEAGTRFRRPGTCLSHTYAIRDPQDVIAEMVRGNDCSCLLHSKDPFQLLDEFVQERRHWADFRARLAG